MRVVWNKRAEHLLLQRMSPLQRKSIREDGAQALADALKTNKALTALNLEYNSIGDRYQVLAESLKANSTVTTLHLAINLIGENGARALSEALKTNSTLTNLDVGNNIVL